MDRAALAVSLILLSGSLLGQAPTSDSTAYWEKEHRWRVRSFGHTLGIEVAWTDAYDLEAMRMFARDAGVIEEAGEHDRMYFLSASLAIQLHQDVVVSRVDNGRLSGHQWKLSLERYLARTSGMLTERDSIAGNSLYRRSTVYLWAQDEIALGAERRWRTNEDQPFYLGAGLGASIGTTLFSALFIHRELHVRELNDELLLESSEDQYTARACSYLRAHLTGRAGVRLWQRLDIAVEGAYGAGLQAIHGSGIRPITSRVAAGLAVRWTLKND